MKRKSNKSYDGWLVSNNFWKRAMAVWLYGSVIQAVIYAIIFFIFLVWAFA